MLTDTLGSWLFAQTWQVALLVLLVTAVAARWGRSRPHLAHALWIVVLLKCFTPPIWASPSGLFCWLSPVAADRSADAREGADVATDSTDLGSLRVAERESPLAGAVVEVGSWDPSALGAGAGRAASGWTAAPRDLLMRTAVGVWVVGAVLALSLGALRARRFVARLRRAPAHEVDELTAAVERLRRRLAVRRAVRVVVTRAEIGPVIVGLLRPTIYLPAALVEGWDAAGLEPILAHELVHQRRGDLWLCWLQWLARGLWWFHPAVAWACRCWNREVERCCDEETVASMDYPPGRYARSLLSVLERKMELRAAPVFPGVRPLDVTAYRLERIMRLGQGSRRRAPLWCWGLMVVVSLAVLPGAAFVAEAKDRRRARRPPSAPTTASPNAATSTASGALSSGASTVRPDGPVAAGDANAEADQYQFAVEILTCDSDAWERAIQGIRCDQMAAVCDGPTLRRITKMLEADRATNRMCAPRVLTYEGRTAQVSTMTQHSFVTGYETPAADKARVQPGEWITPRPIVKTLEEGVRIELCGVRENDEQIRLHFAATLGLVPEVTTFRDAAGREIQQPRRSENRVQATARLSSQQSLVYSLPFQQRVDGKPERIVYIVRYEKAGRSAAPASILRSYPVADLVVPVVRVAELDVRSVVVAAPPQDPQPAPAPVKPADFSYDPLIKLIKSTVTPDAWKPSGTSDVQPRLDQMALVVRADAETHARIAELFTQLRRLQEVQIAYEATLVRPDERLLGSAQAEHWPWREPNRVDAGPPVAALDDSSAQRLQDRLREKLDRSDGEVLRTPNVTLFNGQTLRMTLPNDPAELRRAADAPSDREDEPRDVTVRFVTVASSDRRHLRVTLATGGRSQGDELLGELAVREIRDAQTLVVDLTDEGFARDWNERGPLARSPEGQAVLRNLGGKRSSRPLWLVIKPRVVAFD